MAPQNGHSDAIQMQDMSNATAAAKCPSGAAGARDPASQDGSSTSDHTQHVPLQRWVMHGAVMFGREFCYAMETALVTPVLLLIGLPEQYYSLTWFLSPILGLIFTPLIGSASDRCRLRWGRRRPFILMLCVGVLLGITLFLNGSLIGLSIGDVTGNQPIGIVLTVVGVVVLDFSADASEGPIRAYLLDVADSEEQDMALNVHAFSAGLGGALGYMLSGLDWTNTALGQVFHTQQQVLFFFASIVFIIAVALHLFSIKEESFSPCRSGGLEEEDGDDLSVAPASRPLTELYLIREEEAEHAEMDFMDMVRSKSDSVLAMPDATIELDLDLDLHLGLDLGSSTLYLPEGDPELYRQSDNQTSLLQWEPISSEGVASEANKPANGALTAFSSQTPDNGVIKPGARQFHSPTGRRRHPSFYRQPSFTFAYHGRVGFQRPRRPRAHTGPARLNSAITSSRSLSDLDKLTQRVRRRFGRTGGAQPKCKEDEESEDEDTGTTVKLLWLSMLKMPPQLLRLCLCHLLTWFSIIAQAVFYTDFMGQVIYDGDPTAAGNSTALQNYNRGVQMGCWGLVIYAAMAAVCSGTARPHRLLLTAEELLIASLFSYMSIAAVLQKYLDNYDLSIRVIYMLGTLSFAVGTAVMASIPNVYVAMVMISTMGIISMSISYCPYALLGQYHEIKEYVEHSPGNSRRGFGIDCAILSCQVYISQILVASALGAVVDAVGTVRVIPVVASGGSFLGLLTAAFLVIYPDPDEEEDDDEEEEEDTPPRGQLMESCT
ncbi:solute carrier family 45 member 4-like isoform X1 [Denticeps clupeoides]|uniref:solute carrier family 45 member 4-like isoform X1 n=1 Tax=Denticeps clupeoides TaxID=299321 RepID=UPI0010A3F676|nr:solute carrier family 45 member 4-like isoform X1 [Denticeps clupeoides]